ncbi:helix-turn-helix protein [Gillisia sp. Hel_I_86]|uniref:helix-turn-helix transcriptional regulator n=1 Tax=Gillisia sp. Hel_I_86 TaxID=1249981 RepID=UPI00119A2E7A|nr:helix-turn-helix transcriptional regulator [Gillisia sp. Hel_I_86]TVZ28509.1 helix-turn-helix protein [Gillisia sp. Hel_I_86]
MVNSEEFSKRLQIILDYYDISAAVFADAIHVGRSSISHILSGRNKPSLDFVLKIVQTYPEVELYWLLNGKGNFPKSEPDKTIPSQKPEAPAPLINDEKSKIAQPIESSFTPKSFPGSNFSAKTIKRVVLFYEDGTFEAFEN